MRVSEIVYEAGVPRERHVRSTDPVIVIWHDKGEDAPALIIAGRKVYRTPLIEMP